MTHKLTDLDVDGVMPKTPPDGYHPEYRLGYYMSCAEHQALGVEIDVEGLAEFIFHLDYPDHNWVTTIAKDDYLRYVKAIANNPKVLRMVSLNDNSQKS